MCLNYYSHAHGMPRRTEHLSPGGAAGASSFVLQVPFYRVPRPCSDCDHGYSIKVESCRSQLRQEQVGCSAEGARIVMQQCKLLWLSFTKTNCSRLKKKFREQKPEIFLWRLQSKNISVCVCVCMWVCVCVCVCARNINSNSHSYIF